MQVRNDNEAPLESAPAEEKPRIIVNDRRHWAREDEGDDEDGQPRKPTYVAELESKLEAQEKLVAEIRAQAKSAKSEFENARARLQREVQVEVKRGVRQILTSLLDVMDNLDRAVEAAEDPKADEDSLRHGMKMVREQFLHALSEVGVERLDTVGQPFDPARHEAVSNVPVADPSQDSRVVGEIKGLYVIGDEVLRPGVVAVGQHQG